VKMTAHPNMIDEIPPHADADAPEPAPDRPPRPPLTSLERVNGILGRWYRLQHTVDAYDALHNAELSRLNRRRAEAVGPTERRISRLRSSVEDFAVQAFLGFGELGHRVPNGDITSRPVVVTIDKTDADVAEWLSKVHPSAVEMRPQVDMKKLRAWIDARVKAGHLQRMVSKPLPDGDVEFSIVDESKGWPWEFERDQVGVWFWTEEGVETEMDLELVEGDVLFGVSWIPNGTQGSGRNFKVKL